MDRHIVQHGRKRGLYALTVWRPRESLRWVPRAKASRLSKGEATRLASEVGGRVVKLVAPARVQALVPELEEFISEHARGAAPRLDCHWVHGANDYEGSGIDEGMSFCYDCCLDKVEELEARNPVEAERVDLDVDGGWSSEHDSTQFCETCGAKLSGSLTGHGQDEELEHFRQSPPRWNAPDDWDDVSVAVDGLEDDDPRWADMARWVKLARTEEARHLRKEQERNARPRLQDARGKLLGLLLARAEQQREKPSFRLWAELAEYAALPWEVRHTPSREVRHLSRNLLTEAEGFLRLLGLRLQGSHVETAYGRWNWEQVVMVEQHRLWATPAFLAGQAYMRAPCPTGDVEGPHRRDDNPYPRNSPEHKAWDLGFISVPKGEIGKGAAHLSNCP